MGQPKTAPARQNKNEKWPRSIRCGSVEVKVYKVSGSKTTPYFQVADYSRGKRRLRSFTKQTKALEEARRLARNIASGDITVARLTNAEAASYARAIDHLKPTGDSVELATALYSEAISILGSSALLTTAVKEYVRRHPVNLPTKQVSEVVAELIEVKTNRDASPRYIQDLKSRLERFANSFQKSVTNITTPDIQEWLDSLKLSSQSYRNYRTVLHSLFEFCIARHYVIENPVDGIERPKVKHTDKAIYTPDEISALIHASDRDFLPYLVIGAFAGLRSSEIERLSWSDIRDGSIHVTAGKAKTASRRIVPLLDNLSAFLSPYLSEGGNVWRCSHNRLYNQQQNVAKLAGVQWKQNALRHSFASYRFAKIKNEAQVAYELGNSATVVHRHYKELVSEKQATSWFAIKPSSRSNVIDLRKAAKT